jgi:hypothetical protein
VRLTQRWRRSWWIAARRPTPLRGGHDGLDWGLCAHPALVVGRAAVIGAAMTKSMADAIARVPVAPMPRRCGAWGPVRQYLDVPFCGAGDADGRLPILALSQTRCRRR